jgi:Ice-binding-like
LPKPPTEAAPDAGVAAREERRRSLLAQFGRDFMSTLLHPRRLRRVLVAVTALLALAIVPAAAEAAPVNLATAGPFVVLGGAEVENTGPSVLNGDLGVSPGTSLTGFGLPAVVNGATHDNDAVASQAQADLTTAFDVAGEQPVPPGNELTGIDLGGLTLTAGAYNYSSSAQLTGQLTLNAQGNPNAEFVFIIGSTLTTASASSVSLINGASPCNVYWRIGSSATLGAGTQFEGNLMALTSVSLNDAVHVQGRILARNAKISLINDVLDNSQCSTSTETPPAGTVAPATSPISTPVTPATGAVAPRSSTATKATPIASKIPKKKNHRPTPTNTGSSTVTHGDQGPSGTPVKVGGKSIGKIVIKVDNQTVETSHAPSLKMNVNGTPGPHTVTVRVTYKDHTPGKTTTFQIHVPSPAPLHPHPGPSTFTG